MINRSVVRHQVVVEWGLGSCSQTDKQGVMGQAFLGPMTYGALSAVLIDFLLFTHTHTFHYAHIIHIHTHTHTQNTHSTPPLQYSLLFPSQRIRNSWEKDFLTTKQAANNQALPSTPVAPPTSPPPVPDSVSSHLQFLHPILVQSGRVGIEVSER